MSRWPTGLRADHAHAADQARQMAGQWVLAASYASSASANSTGTLVRLGEQGRLTVYGPAGAFDARTELTEDGADLYVRYVTDEPENRAESDFHASIGAELTESFTAFSERMAAAKPVRSA
ncbi:hypothetical protein [Streptomyces sp. NPDC001089]